MSKRCLVLALLVLYSCCSTIAGPTQSASAAHPKYNETKKVNIIEKDDDEEHVNCADDDASVTSRIKTIIDKVVQLQASGSEGGKERELPFITLTFAQSVDGKIAMFLEDSSTTTAKKSEGKEAENVSKSTSSNFPISGKESLLLTHGLRSIHDGILVGGRTFAIDNPRLSNRLWKSDDGSCHQPRPVVLDTNLRHWHSVLQSSPRAHNLIICCSKEAAANADVTTITTTNNGKKATILASAATLLPCETSEETGKLILSDVLKNLKEQYGMHSIMIEGGAQILASFAEEKLMDCFVITISPKVLGANGLPVFRTSMFSSTSRPSQQLSRRQVGRKTEQPHVEGYLQLQDVTFLPLAGDCILIGKI